MKLNEVKKIIFLVLMILTQFCHSEYPVVHSEDKLGIISLIKKLGISESNFSVTDRKQYTDTYSEYFIGDKRYAGKKNNNLSLIIYTDETERVVGLDINRIDIDNLDEISTLSSLKVLDLALTNIKDLKGLNRLKNLEYFKLSGTKYIKNLNYFKNMPKLMKVEASVLGQLNTNKMNRLPNLEEFLCGSCTISDIEPFKEMKKLKVFKSGVIQKDISALSELKQLEVLEIGGGNLADISAVNSMPKLKHLKVSDSSVKEINLDGTTKDLEYVRIVDTPIKDLPAFHLFKQLKNLSITGTEISVADSIYDLPKLERLVLARNLKLKTVKSLKNLPKLKELKAYNGGVDEFSTGSLPNLEELTLSKTNITNLPPFHNYPNLRELYLKETKIKSLKGVEVANNLYRVYTDYDVMKAPENAKLLRELRKNRFKWMKNKTKE